MTLLGQVRVARRFQRSIRIDTDLGDPKALEGFVCPRSSVDVLHTMAQHVRQSRHGAFTWTGPYGTGKSSLVVALSALLNGDAGLRSRATKLFGREVASSLWKHLPLGTKGWRVLPVVGRRENPVAAIGEAVDQSGFLKERRRGAWSEAWLIDALTEIAASSSASYGGLVVFIDEMGKFLENAAHDGTDIYFFQQLAEAAARSEGRLIVVGILHQAFEEYAQRLSHQIRDEWAKIQGRFVDLAINAAAEEQIDLLSRAIESRHKGKPPSQPALSVARIVRPERAADAQHLARMLEDCWPLHPAVAALLGPISRRRFGQNQRSLFGFLNSSEPHGFQDFLKRSRDDSLYSPDRLWDYLRANLEPSILASPDGHRWALAAEALERCEGLGGDALHLSILKTIALVDLFKERSGLLANIELLRTCFPSVTSGAIQKALVQLAAWSLIIFKKFLNSYAVFAGSDFDIDDALRQAIDDVEQIDFNALKHHAGLQPVLAKRHYHDTGALRWFDVNLAPVRDLESIAAVREPANGTIGQFLLAIPTEGEIESRAADVCRKAARQSEVWDVVVGLSARSWVIVDLARDLLALENVRNDRPELAGDAVARREVDARLALLQGNLEMELRRAFDGATWYRKGHQPKTCRQAELNSLASDLADHRFSDSPRLHSELLNRQRPSSNAIAAQNALLRFMVLRQGEPRLGIEGFPAEGGLFVSLLEGPGLYAEGPDGWRFALPHPAAGDPHRLVPLWEAALCHIRESGSRPVSVAQVYDLWRAPPFGVKDGLMPVLAVALILSQRDHIALYRDGIFRARFDDVDVDYLAKDPSMIQLRWMSLTDASRRILSGMAEIVRQLDVRNSLVHLEPIDVARGLVAIYEQLPPWTKRTTRLSANAVRVRELFKQARDPNKFLFDDIPESLAGATENPKDTDIRRVVKAVHDGLEELIAAYRSMLYRLRDMMLAELQVPNLSPQSLAELRQRAFNIRDLAGDFRLEAFVGRLNQFEGTDEHLEGIVSLVADKPPRDWVDPDVDRGAIEITDMAQKFLRAETFARVKGRSQKRHAMAVFIGMEGRPIPIMEEFAVADADRVPIDDLIARVVATLDDGDTSRRSVILAALAEVSARYMKPDEQPRKNGIAKAVR